MLITFLAPQAVAMDVKEGWPAVLAVVGHTDGFPVGWADGRVAGVVQTGDGRTVSGAVNYVRWACV